MNKTTLNFLATMNLGTIERMAPAQLITRITEPCKDMNFYNLVKICESGSNLR